MSPIPTNGYATTATLKSYLAISDTVDDSELDQAIDAASRDIDGHCRRRFYADGTTSTRVYNPIGSYLVRTDDISTTTGVVVETDTADDGTYGTTISSDNYQLEPLNGVSDGIEGHAYTAIRLIESDTFPTAGRRPRVRVTADWGWAATPEPVQQACLILSAALFKMKDAPLGHAGGAEVGLIRVRDNPKVAMLLEPYRRGGATGVG